ncbi:hypothetical protein CXB51_005660 [Gossypium anomalum]|uniref:Reverse transcriptase Ty1/copia-type domain-containing protein n=1 Tax=Gossypium anomalum TaxID=47600 RepID=A0A8J5Z2U0_9ROSI|nr:hypothetical protein CXB51_005660 [Gossypium anomalum]
MGNGAPVPIVHVGTSSIVTGSRLLHLKHVLHVPNVCKILIYVAQFARDNQVFFEFHPYHCFVNDIKTGTVLLVGNIHKGLYQFDTSPPQGVFAGSGADAYSRYNWMYLLKSKFKVLAKFVQFYKFVEVQFGCKIKMLQSDWGDEYKPLATYRSRACTYLGYNLNHKSYNCLDDSGRIFVSSHVVFDEAFYPFAKTEAPTTKTGLSMLHQQPSSSGPSVANLLSGADDVLHARVSSPIGQTNFLATPSPDSQFAGSLEVSQEPSLSSSNLSSACGPMDQLGVTSTSSVAPGGSNTHPMQTRSKCGIFKPKLYAANLDGHEPLTIDEAFLSPEWTKATQQLYDALMHNQTWELVSLPPNRRAVGCKWVFKLKRHADGSVARYKVKFGWNLRQVEINNAFLNGDLNEEIYMLQPPGFERHNGGQPLSDASLFIKQSSEVLLYVLVYVDIIVTGNHQSSIDAFVDSLDSSFSLKDLGKLSYFLGIDVTHIASGLFLNQHKYIQDLLQRSHMEQSKGTPTPMISSCMLSAHTWSPIENEVCQFMHKPLDLHFKAVKRILRYLQATIDHGVHFTAASRLSLVGYSDACWGNDLDDRRSTSGFCVFLGVEAEYRSLGHAAAEVTWLESLLGELRVQLAGKAVIWCDNSNTVTARKLIVGHVPAQD